MYRAIDSAGNTINRPAAHWRSESSSGNWKDSNQPNIHPAANGETSFGPLLNHNREWHAMVDNPNLAAQFDGFIEYVFSEAERVPVDVPVPAPPPDLFVPVAAMLEARVVARYFRPLEVNRRLEIQPLLTPDNYVSQVTEVIRETGRTNLFQNQSFNLLKSNEAAVEDVFKLLKDKQGTCKVEIILLADVYLQLHKLDVQRFCYGDCERL